MSQTITNSIPIPPNRFAPWLMCAVAALFYCYEYLLRIAPSAMESDLMLAYDISAAGVGLISAYYFVAYTPLQLPVGVMMDKFGPRRVITLAVFCCTFGVAMLALSSNFNLALLGRFLIGFGSAFAFVGVLKLASIWLPPERFAFIAGATTALGMGGAMVGQNLLLLMVNQVGMEKTLLYACGVGVALIPLIWLVIKDAPPDHETSEPDLTFKKLFKDILQVFGNSQIWINGLAGALIMLPTTVFAEMWGGLFFKSYYGFEPKIATYATSMIFLGWAIGGPIAGYISDTIKRRVLPLLLGSFVGSLIMLVLIYGPILPTWLLFGMLFLFGAVSSTEIICFAIAKEKSKGSVAGTAIAMTNFIVVFAGFFQWVVAKLLDFSRHGLVDASGHPIYSIEDFKFALIMLPLSMIVGFVMCFFIVETNCKSLQDD